MNKRTRKLLILVAKVAVAVALLAWVLSKVQFFGEGGLLSIIRHVNGWLAALGTLGFAAGLFVLGARLWMLLRIQEIHISLWESIRLTVLGQFFNTVVPGSVGGDLVKAYYIAKHTPKKAAVMVCVFFDRVMALVELTLLAAAMVAIVLITGMETYTRIGAVVISMGVILTLTTGTLVFLLSRRFRSLFHLQKLYGRLSIAHHFAAAGHAAARYRERLPALLPAVLITFGSHVVWISSIAAVGASLSLPIPAYAYFLYMPLIYIIGAIPITPGGVGLIENFYLVFLAGMAEANGVVALALLVRLLQLVVGLPGIIVAATGPKLPKGGALEAELGLTEEQQA